MEYSIRDSMKSRNTAEFAEVTLAITSEQRYSTQRQSLEVIEMQEDDFLL